MLLLAVNVALVICSPLNVLSMNTQRRQSSHIAHVKTHSYRYIYIYIFYKTAKKVAVVYSQKEYKIIFTCCFVFI